jgi:hypothetical protein
MIGMKKQQWLWAVLALATAGLACATNTPVAQVAPARPTRTPLPTFTNTPLPTTPTFTPTPNAPTEAVDVAPVPDEPLPTDTPAPADTPIPPTDTPVPPTDTPVPPTNTPPPPPPPPTATFTPPPTPTAAVVSVVATPTNTPQPDTPAGRYEVRSEDDDRNCAHVAVVGRVVEKGSERPVQFVAIEVSGDEDPYKGPFVAKTNSDGYYTIVIDELNENVDGIDFKVQVIGGDNVDSEDEPRWQAGDNCSSDEDNDDIQVMEINWYRKD